MIICHHVPQPGTPITTLCQACGHAALMHSGLSAPCAVCQILAVAEQLATQVLPMVAAAMRTQDAPPPPEPQFPIGEQPATRYFVGDPQHREEVDRETWDQVATGHPTNP